MRWAPLLLLFAGCDGVFGLQSIKVRPDAPPDMPCFVDSFAGTAFDPRWTIASPTSTKIAVADADELKFEYSANAPATSYNALVTASAVDFRTGSITAELVEPPTLHRETNLRASSSATEYFSLGLRYDLQAPAPRLIAKINDGSAEVFDRPWVAATDHWFRIRFEGTEVTFETSPDGVMWQGKSVLVPKAPVAESVLFMAYVTGNATGTEAASLARWDNVTVRALDCGQ